MILSKTSLEIQSLDPVRQLAAALALFVLLILSSWAQAEDDLFSKPNSFLSQSASTSSSPEPEFLKVEEAFKSSVAVKQSSIIIHWEIAPEYYLYHSKFTFKAQPEGVSLGEPVFSKKGKIKHDEIFGEVEVFYDQVQIEIPVLSSQGDMTLIHGYQGCAEAGLCYPPERVSYPVSIKVDSKPTHENASPTAKLPPPAKLESKSSESTFSSKDANSLASFIQNSSLPTVIAVFFAIGLGLTFTPCVLPMVPILSSIIAGQQGPVSARKGFILSTAYVLGMALSFALAGMLVSLGSARIQVYMQHPVVLSVFAALFALLALSMFNLFELQMPSFLTDRLNQAANRQKTGHLGGVFAMGAISALVVSPCVSPPLAGALLAMAQAGDMVKGGLTLLALGLGMGAPLIIIGTTGANFLPRAGQWMEQIKVLFGFLLLGVSIWLIRSVLPGLVVMWLWASLIIMASVHLGAFAPLETNGWSRFRKGLGIILLIQGFLILAGAAGGSTNPITPLMGVLTTAGNTTHSNPGTQSSLAFQRIYTLEELKDALASARSQQSPVMLDYYADWCISCIEMEHTTFSNAEVIQALSGFKLLQIDLTDNPQTNDLLDLYNLFGPPSILFFSYDGELITDASVMGEMGPDTFLTHLEHQVTPNL